MDTTVAELTELDIAIKNKESGSQCPYLTRLEHMIRGSSFVYRGNKMTFSEFSSEENKDLHSDYDFLLSIMDNGKDLDLAVLNEERRKSFDHPFWFEGLTFTPLKDKEYLKQSDFTFTLVLKDLNQNKAFEDDPEFLLELHRKKIKPRVIDGKMRDAAIAVVLEEGDEEFLDGIAVKDEFKNFFSIEKHKEETDDEKERFFLKLKYIIPRKDKPLISLPTIINPEVQQKVAA